MHRGTDVVPQLGCALKSTPPPIPRPLTAPSAVHNNNNHNNTKQQQQASSPVRKELGPSPRPALPRNDVTLPAGGGLVHSRSGASLQRGSYDGKIAGLYDLEETLGRGHFAVVKLARHVFTGEKVAVKVIDKTKLDEVSRAHLFQEVRCMKLVQHPNVVRLYEVIDTQTKLYLILELADGGDLYDYIMRHEEGLVEDQARIYFRQIVNAISYCHKLHVVHRDLKPENVVFFERLGVVKLTDFGFSNRFDPGQKLETSCGSLAYSAPEILLGDSYDAPAVDVWSLGVILYMLVCGHAPFQEANDSETLTMIMDCKYSIPPYVSPACARLIGRMLVRAPERRASLEELAADPWLTAGASISPGELEVPLVSRESLSEEDHTHILHKMVAGKIATKEEILEALDKNEYNHITATYFLLAERKLRAQRQEAVQRNSTMSGSLTKSTLLAATPSPLLLSPGSPGELLLGKPNVSLVPALTPPRLLPSNTLSVPSESQEQQARGRKCSIVTEEEDDEGDGDSSRDGSTTGPGRCSLNRRGSRSEGKLSLALQQRLAEVRASKLAAPPPPIPQQPSPLPVRTTQIIASSATITLPSTQTQPPTTSPARFKTLPAPSRPLHSVCSSPQLTLNEIFEEGAEKPITTTTTTSTTGTTGTPAAIPRVVVTRQKFHKNRTASCSSSDASDEDSESRKKRAHKLPSNTRRRDSHDDPSSQGGPSGGSNSGGGDTSTPDTRPVSDSTGEKQSQNSGSGTSNGRRHTGFRRRCGTAGETRLRESQSLNRITEVQESSESLTQTLNHTSTAATSPRSRRGLGARFLLLVGKKPAAEPKEEKENCSKTKITRYFHLHRKLCLPIFKANNNNNNNNHSNHSGSGPEVWLGASGKQT